MVVCKKKGSSWLYYLQRIYSITNAMDRNMITLMKETVYIMRIMLMPVGKNV